MDLQAESFPVFWGVGFLSGEGEWFVRLISSCFGTGFVLGGFPRPQIEEMQCESVLLIQDSLNVIPKS